MTNHEEIIDQIKFNDSGLVPVIAQDKDKNVLMLAWMNKESLKQTLNTKAMCYFSRSRNKLWVKGETSGNTQKLIHMSLDCDSDAILATIEQTGVACHTGARSCFFKTISEEN